MDARLFFDKERTNGRETKSIEKRNATIDLSDKIDTRKIDPTEFLKSFMGENIVTEHGKIGYKISWMKPGSNIEKAGIKMGDVIQAINSQELNKQPEKNGAVSLLQSLKEQK